jgi:hypothetical protein
MTSHSDYPIFDGEASIEDFKVTDPCGHERHDRGIVFYFKNSDCSIVLASEDDDILSEAEMKRIKQILPRRAQLVLRIFPASECPNL